MKNHRLIKFLLPLAFYLALWFFAWKAVGHDLLLPGPSSVLSRFNFVLTRPFWQTVFHTLARTMAAYFIGIALAFVLAIFSHWSEWLCCLIQPAMTVIRATPVASFIILALVWLSSRTVPVFAGVLMVLPVVYSSTYEGLSAVHPHLKEMAHLFGFNQAKSFRNISLPSILPTFLASCESSVGLCFKATVASQVIGLPKNAIGTMLHNSKVYLETDALFAWTIMVIVLSLLLEKLLRLLFGRWMRHAHHS